MKKKYLILGAVLFVILGMVVLYPKTKKEKTRQEIIKIEKEKKLQEDLKEAKKELEKIVKKNEIMIKEIEENEIEEQKVLEKVKIEILTEVDDAKRDEKLDGLLEGIDQYKYSREFSIPTLLELKGKLSENETRKINERLYKLYQSTDEFDKAEKIKMELNGGGNIDGEDDKEEL